MTHDRALRKLGDYVGVEPGYWDIDGNYHETSDDTRRKFLSALGYPADSEHAAIQSLHKLEDDVWRLILEPVYVRRIQPKPSDSDNETISILVRLPEGETNHSLHWFIELENNDEISGRFSPEELQPSEWRTIDAIQYIAFTVYLPNTIPTGYHKLRISIGNRQAQSQLIIAPPHAYLPTELGDNSKRVWGIATQVYALRGDDDTGIGDFTALHQLCKHVAKNNGDVVGLSPLHTLFVNDPSRVSPYAPSSRLFINMALVDLEHVIGFSNCPPAQARLREPEVESQLKLARNAQYVDYPTVVQVKREIFQLLFEHFQTQHLSGPNTPESQDFENFIREGGDALLGFAAFEALQDKFDGLTPSQWPKDFQTISSTGSQAFIQEHQDRVQFYQFVQWQADRQLLSIAASCKNDGMLIGLYRDLAVGAVSDGADVWMEPDVFVSNINIGAPPDAFSETGQDWGIPPLHPINLKETAYRPFIDMLRANMRHAGAIRIDHAMWLQHVFWIPNGETGQNGAYVSYPMDDLFNILALESHRNRCVVIGEDLGTVPSGFRERMEQENVLSYRLMMFERHPDGLFKRPDTYPPLSLATPASHDLPPISGFWAERDIDTALELGLIDNEEGLDAARQARQLDREVLIAALADQGLLSPEFPATAELSSDQSEILISAIHAFMGKTPSAICMVNLEDVLSLQSRINLPGTVDEHPNWRHRIPMNIEAIAHSGFIERCAKRLNLERGHNVTP